MNCNDRFRMKTLVSLLFFAIAATDAFCIVVDKVLVIVNDEVITQREVAQLLSPVYEQYKKEYTGTRFERKMLEAEDMIIDQLIDDKLILSEARRQGIEVSSKEIEDRLQKLRDRFETEEQFRSKLAEENISLSELRKKIKNDMMKQKLLRMIMGSKVTITPAEVRQYYDSHIEDFTKLAKAKVFNILIKKEKDGRSKEEAKFLIEKIYELVKKGEDFESLVKEYSESPNAKNGGLLGLIEKGEMIEEIDNAIFSLDAEAVSGIVESPLGYHIFKVTERFPGEIVDFEIAKDDIEELIYGERIDKNLKKWLKELRKNAYISIK